MVALKNLQFAYKTLSCLITGNVVQPEDIQKDYDRLSIGYDEFFSTHVAPHSRWLVDRVGIGEGSRAVDLACGTGTLTLRAADRVGRRGQVVGVDRSTGMLSVARAKAVERGLVNTRFMKADMLEGIESFGNESLDAVTCGWAIGYTQPVELLKVAARKLVPGGKVGLIENARDTLAPVRQTCLRVARTFPQSMRCVMDLHLRLPTSRGQLERWFRKAGLKPITSWEGNVTREFRSGTAVLDWVLHTGASAGFDRMMEPSMKKQCDKYFVRYIEEDFLRDGRIEVAHHFVAGIAGKEEG